MKIKKIAIAAICMAALLLGATACKKTLENAAGILDQVKDAAGDIAKGKIQLGSWSEDGGTFTNEWSNIKFTLPEGWSAMTEDELNQLLAAGADILVNDGAVSQAELDLSGLKTAYDFGVYTGLGMPNVMLTYENLSLTLGAGNLDEQGYYDVLKEQILAVDSLGLVETGVYDKTIGDEKYLVGSFEALDGLYVQDYYIRKDGGVIIAFIVTYNTETRPQADVFMAAITPAK
jgi:hypothetical protein